MDGDWLTSDTDGAIPVEAVRTADWPAWLEGQAEVTRRWAEANGFAAAAGAVLLLPDGTGGIGRVLVGVGTAAGPWALASLPGSLPPGRYRLADGWPAVDRDAAVLGWGLGAYRFRRYRGGEDERGRVLLAVDPAELDASVVELVAAVRLVRDLINTPAGDMMPVHLAAAARGLAERFGADFHETVGDDLATSYPCLHTVGRASAHAPRRIALDWGDPAHPELVLIGKGVCFDSGGLDIKPSSGMRLMKKDMGGAAHVLGLAQLVMAARLPVRLKLRIGAAENAVSGTAFRPGDVIVSRKGLSIEVENTDAEGRLVLCDLLAEAGEGGRPDLIVDFATLTGAARVALGTGIGAYFSSDDSLAAELDRHARAEDDPLWRLPLHAPYRDELDSRVADLMNCSAGSYGGAITAALFLREFVPEGVPWLHFDVMAWNRKSLPGRPEGGEAMGLRALFSCLRARYSAAPGEP